MGAEPGREPNPDRSNAIVLVVISAIVAAGIVGLALLASSGAGPNLELERPLIRSHIDRPMESTGGG